jgi:two-component system sensor histidine kinase AlgZ
MPLNTRYWLRMLGWSVVASTTAVALFSGATWRTPWRYLVQPFAISFVFSASIIPLAAIAMPRLMRRVHGRMRFPLDWVIVVVVMAAIGVAGSMLAIGVLRAIGYIRPEQTRVWLLASFRQSVLMTLIFGISISAFESMRARLDAATLALRTKKRDEAEARRLAAEAQLASLESRVNPHFLFNTLNSIATLVHDNPPAAERMTTQLAALLRSSLDAGSPLVPIADELQVVRAYLDIERTRFGDRLRYEVRADEAAATARVPRLAVQTLVENSVKYAVSPRREGGAIAVRAAIVDGRVRIEVEDDGPGFDPAAAAAGHGLALVRARLSAAFGDRAALEIRSAPGATVASIAVPAAS